MDFASIDFVGRIKSHRCRSQMRLEAAMTLRLAQGNTEQKQRSGSNPWGLFRRIVFYPVSFSTTVIKCLLFIVIRRADKKKTHTVHYSLFTPSSMTTLKCDNKGSFALGDNVDDKVNSWRHRRPNRCSTHSWQRCPACNFWHHLVRMVSLVSMQPIYLCRPVRTSPNGHEFKCVTPLVYSDAVDPRFPKDGNWLV